MARSIANAKLISDQFSVVFRRGYAVIATANGSGSVRGSGVAMMKKGGEESRVSNPWVPDPVTGYYKPEGQTDQLDAADLRDLLLKQKSRRE